MQTSRPASFIVTFMVSFMVLGGGGRPRGILTVCSWPPVSRLLSLEATNFIAHYLLLYRVPSSLPVIDIHGYLGMSGMGWPAAAVTWVVQELRGSADAAAAWW